MALIVSGSELMKSPPKFVMKASAKSKWMTLMSRYLEWQHWKCKIIVAEILELKERNWISSCRHSQYGISDVIQRGS